MIEFTYQHAQIITQQALAAAMVNDRQKIISLLRKYGIAVDSSYTDQAIIFAVLKALQDDNMNPRFSADLKKLLADRKPPLKFAFSDQEMYLNETGCSDPFDPRCQPGYTGNTTTTTTTKDKSTLGQLVGDPALWSSLINTGTNVLSDSLKAKNDKQLAQTALQIEQEKTRQAEIKAAGGGGDIGKKMGTGTIVLIVLGSLALLGTIGYFAFRPKKVKANG